MQKITKAVFPVAGLGTRFLPATKASPKEMLPVVDKPVIQYAVEEAVAAGITELIFVTGRSKRAIEDHFDKAYELEAELATRGKDALLKEVRSILPAHVTCVYVRQAEALGLGHAVLCAKQLVGQEPFAVILADDLIDASHPVLSQMCALYERSYASVLGVQEIPRHQSQQYGMVATSTMGPRTHRVSQIVEKPAPEDAPSNLAVVGRYILSPSIFRHLEMIPPGKGGEIQLTDGIAAMMKEEPVLAWEFEGVRYDCGSKMGYLQATLALAVRHPEVGDEFKSYLRKFAEGC
jgi:UTP--glucose-1-phosphate uridylyltransferase